MLIHNVHQEGLICPVAVNDIFKNVSYVQWSLVDILNEICLQKIFITSEIYLFSFIGYTVFFKNSCQHIVAITQSTIKIYGTKKIIWTISQNDIN